MSLWLWGALAVGLLVSWVFVYGLGVTRGADLGYALGSRECAEADAAEDEQAERLQRMIPTHEHPTPLPR